MAQMLQPRLRYGYRPRVEIPESLRIGLPGPFFNLVRRWGQPAPEIMGLEGQWLKVSGGPLPLPIAVRVDQAPDGRFIITGLLIGLDSRTEITWETLRQIKPQTILAYIFSGFDSKDPAAIHDTVEHVTMVPGEDFDEEAWRAGHDGADPPPWIGKPMLTPRSWREQIRAMAAHQLWMGLGRDEHSLRPVEAVTKSRASAAANLTEFAEVYLRHLAATPHKATTATAKELHISRATAIRRLADARSLGLIPPKDTKR
jgi:hypothetical protein